MTADPQMAQMDAWLAANRTTWRYPKTPADFEDEDTLRRSRGGLSRAARRESRRPRVDRPTEPWQDDVAATNPGWRDAS
jgi:hypothetical protein